MGIGVETLRLLTNLRKEGHLRRRMAIVEIGAQQLAASFLQRDMLTRLGYMYGIDTEPPILSGREVRLVHGDIEHLERDAQPARDFWNWIGYEYASIDIDGTPGSIPLDLNVDAVPEDWVGRFDLVTNFGTTEHVANQMNAFQIVHDLTAVDGIMVHALPAQGMMNHGLINYNFKFFWMLARSNGYAFVYADFTGGQSFGLPDNVVDFLGRYNTAPDKIGLQSKVVDGGLTVVMKKLYDIPYVPPLDVPSGAAADDPDLAKRYWTVFDPEAFKPYEEERQARLARRLPGARRLRAAE